jgi:hypothetical protein
MYNTQNSAQKATTVTDRVIRYINATPPSISGGGGHNQTLKLTINLVHGFCMSGPEALSFLETHYNPKCDPHWSTQELEHKVSEALKMSSIKPRGWLLNGSQSDPVKLERLPAKRVVMPKPNPVENIHNFLGDFRCTQEDLINKSPYKLTGIIQEEHFHRQGPMLLEYLYEPDDLIRVVTTSKQSEKGKYHPFGYGRTLPRNVWSSQILQAPQKRSGGGCWMGMNPLDGYGVSDRNVTRFPYALFESDEVSIGLQASFIAKVKLPIAAIVFSGGRSLQALVKLDSHDIDQYEGTVSNLLKVLGKYGADTKNRNASRMCRLPGVYRGDQQQRLVYLNPEPSIESIL